MEALAIQTKRLAEALLLASGSAQARTQLWTWAHQDGVSSSERGPDPFLRRDPYWYWQPEPPAEIRALRATRERDEDANR